MNIEHSRTSGFVISPLCVPEAIVKREKPVREKRQILSAEAFPRFWEDFYEYSRIFTKKSIKSALSVAVAVSTVLGFCSFFTIGTAIYYGDKPVAFANSEEAYYNSLSSAKSIAESHGKNIEEFNSAPAIVPRSHIARGQNL